QQAVGKPKKALFGVFAKGSGNQAAGTMTFYAGSPLKLVTATNSCLVINGNDAIVTGSAVIDNQTQTVVAELVDNTSPSDPSNPDLLRFSFAPFITPDPDHPGCYLSTLPPIAIKAGDLSIVPAA